MCSPTKYPFLCKVMFLFGMSFFTGIPRATLLSLTNTWNDGQELDVCLHPGGLAVHLSSDGSTVELKRQRKKNKSLLFDTRTPLLHITKGLCYHSPAYLSPGLGQCVVKTRRSMTTCHYGPSPASYTWHCLKEARQRLVKSCWQAWKSPF